MKKKLLQNIFLIMLPFLAAGLGATQDSVTVAYQQTGVTEFYSYFDLIPVAQMQLLLPLAGVLCLVTGILAVVGITAKKPGCLKAIKVTTFAATTAAVAPILTRGEILVIPHVALPLIMTAEFLFALAATGKSAAKADAGKVVQLKKY